ncbi:uncharacterized protein TRAVEDRAFT_119574, partial [Trametes versicolor FP-101664 SS1]|uniref:uncharacterized protein n=1 Tax=Trametes versicolor (strain FP-101664) TaxID=717944 RepID=UPI00046223FB
GVLIRDVWNSDLTTLLPKSESYPNLAQWQVVPQVYDDLCAWALVERSDEETGTFRPFMLLYHPDIYPSSSAPTIVSMRFHGVVESLNILPEKAARSIQYISIDSGGCDDAFNLQLAIIDNIKAYLLSTLKGNNIESHNNKPGTIFFHRPVFTKVSNRLSISSTLRVLRSALVLGDDPHQYALNIRREWLVTHRIVTGLYNNDHSVCKRPYNVIQKGDFVEVKCHVEVMRFRKKTNWVTEVRFVPEAVIRVCDKTTVRVSDLSIRIGHMITEHLS